MQIHYDIDDLKTINKPIVTVGTFDGVHIGHQRIISRINEIAAQKNGESVLLTFHPHPRTVLFPESEPLKLLNTVTEKSNLLRQYGLDHVIYFPFVKRFSRMPPAEYVRDVLVNKIHVNTMVIGYDHHFGRNRQGNLSLLKEVAPVYGFDVEEIPAQEVEEIKVSSTKIRNAILEGDITTANNFLDYPFSFTAKVVRGKQLGRKIGFPTANLSIEDEQKIIPSNGVYVVQCAYKNNCFGGMLNIGAKPTIDDEGAITIEVHLFDFSEDIYNDVITIRFIDKLRNERKFESIDQLKTQLNKDEVLARHILLDL